MFDLWTNKDVSLRMTKNAELTTLLGYQITKIFMIFPVDEIGRVVSMGDRIACAHDRARISLGSSGIFQQCERNSIQP